jgi:hypothetical protein
MGPGAMQGMDTAQQAEQLTQASPDILQMISGGLKDIASTIENVDKGFKEIGQGISDVLHPGNLGSPQAPQGSQPGYGAGQASGPNDCGTVGNSGGAAGAGGAGSAGSADGTSQTDGTDPSQSSDTSDMQAIINDPNASIEDKVFAIMMQLVSKQEDKVKGSINKMGDGKESALSAKESQQLQQDSNKLNQLQSMLTNLQQMFHQTSMSITQNLRG